VVEAERTAALEDYITHTSAAVNYVNQSFSLFKEAAKARPSTLLTPKKRV
jgi:hypothetical protein